MSLRIHDLCLGFWASTYLAANLRDASVYLHSPAIRLFGESHFLSLRLSFSTDDLRFRLGPLWECPYVRFVVGVPFVTAEFRLEIDFRTLDRIFGQDNY